MTGCLRCLKGLCRTEEPTKTTGVATGAQQRKDITPAVGSQAQREAPKKTPTTASDSAATTTTTASGAAANNGAAGQSTTPAPGGGKSVKRSSGAESHRGSAKLADEIVSAWSNYGLERAKTANRSTDDYRLQEDSGANWLSPKSSIHLGAEVELMDPGQTVGILGQYTCSISKLRVALASKQPVLYIVGQVSLGELIHYCKEYPGCILFVQGLPGFNVVEMLENGQLQEATREQVLEVCRENKCLLFSLTAAECIKVGFDQLQSLFATCIPNGHSKAVLNAYRASSFGSFAASTSRGKVKVIDGAATDGLIRSVDVSIGETVERLRAFEVKMYVDAMKLCENDGEKQDIFQEVLDAVISSNASSPEEYLTARMEGFGVTEAFNAMRSKCSSEITTAAYSAGGVLAGCQTPVYDDWTVHQALRILSGALPLDKEKESNIAEHLEFITACMKYVYGTSSTLQPYAAQLFTGIEKTHHLVLHDVGSDTGPDDFPACVMLMAMAKFKREANVQLLAVGGEEKYRAMRTLLLRHLIPVIPNVKLDCAPYLPDVSIPSPFVPMALVTTCDDLSERVTQAADGSRAEGGSTEEAAPAS